MKSYDRVSVREAINFVFNTVADDEQYIAQKTDQFMNRCCQYDGIPSNQWFSGEITQEAIESTAYSMLDIDCQNLLMKIVS